MTARYEMTDILSVEQAAAFLVVSTATVRAQCNLAQGDPERIPNFRMGEKAGAIRIPFGGLVAWIEKKAGCSLAPPRKARTPRRRPMMKTKPRRFSRSR